MAGAKGRSGGARPGSGGSRVGAGRKPGPETIFEREFVGPRLPKRTRRTFATEEERQAAKIERQRERYRKVAGRRKAKREEAARAACAEQGIEYVRYASRVRHDLCCALCGTEFVSKLRSAKFCSSECRIKANNARDPSDYRIYKFHCHVCAEPFEAKTSLARYCSIGCKSKNKNARDYQAKMRDNVAKLKVRIRVLINKAFGRNGFSKGSKTHEILGCSWPEFKRHIERQFLPGMSWARFNEIHIDHVVPLATAKTEADVFALNCHTNLRPLWAKENLSKGAEVRYLL